MRHRVEEGLGLDVIVEADPGQAPLGVLVILGRQRPERRPLDALEELAPAHAEAAHLMGVDALHCVRDRGVALGKREERLTAQPAQDVGLSEADPCLDLGLVARLARAGRQDAEAVVGRHHAVAAVDLGIVKRRLVDPALQIVGNHQTRDAVQEAEQAHVRADPVGQGLGPGRLGVGEVRGAKHGDEDLGLAHLPGHRVDDGRLLARVVDEHPVAGRMVLAHHR